MKKFKLGTRVTVNGIETFIAELHADITRGVYKVRTDNPTYEFTKESNWVTCTCEGKTVTLFKAHKYGNYQVGDEVRVNGYTGLVTSIDLADKNYPVKVKFGSQSPVPSEYTLDGTNYEFASLPVLKKLRVKLGEKK